MHPTSLPGPHGSGDIGAQARRFADFLSDTGQTWWQMLPVGPTGAPPGNSPYSSSSSFAGNPYLIDLSALAEQGLLSRQEIKPTADLKKNPASVNFPAMIAYRQKRLRRAFENFDRLRDDRHAKFGAFCADEHAWLNDYALFVALKNRFNGKGWVDWPRDIRLRQAAAIQRAQRAVAGEIRYQKFLQFIFDRQWQALRGYCNDRGIGLVGDVPIFVAHDSADVWARRELFDLDAAGGARTISGCPPDAFSATGQCWGHPQYSWPAHGREKYAWWIARFAGTFRLFDAVRIDHFLGFARLWRIPAKARTAIGGKWMQTPGVELFTAVRSALGELAIVAEDLGLLTREAEKLRDRFAFPGMRVLQFGLGSSGYHLPHSFPRRCVAYTGTHDNDTIIGWFNSMQHAARKKDSSASTELKSALAYLTPEAGTRNAANLHWRAIAALMQSVADTTIIPMQDLLGLGAEARMNIPGQGEGNWRWRMLPGKLTKNFAEQLSNLTTACNRARQA